MCNMTIDKVERGEDGLPLADEKELASIDKLLSSSQYKIKESHGLFGIKKNDFLSYDFVVDVLNDLMEHVQLFVAYVKRMIPPVQKELFFSAIKKKNTIAEGILKTTLEIDLKALSEMLGSLQASPREVPVAAIQPFLKTLYKHLICIYYLKPDYVAYCFREIYKIATESHVPADPKKFQDDIIAAIQEANYIYSKIFPLMYPLVLRMVSPVMLSERGLFYKNGSKVLAWLEVSPEKILFPLKKKSSAKEDTADDEQVEQERRIAVPERVTEGLKALENLFPEAGWERIIDFPYSRTDFAPYFASIFKLSDVFVQLNPGHPMHFTMLLCQIILELLQGLRQIDFEGAAFKDELHSIIDGWVVYKENIFDKDLGESLEAYTHQLYSQPEFEGTPYAMRLVSNMYSIIRSYFLPFFNTHLHPITKLSQEWLPPLFKRTGLLMDMLKEYTNIAEQKRNLAEIEGGKKPSPDEASGMFGQYQFEVPNPVSRRLDALCSIKKLHKKTNATLIKYCTLIISVLDWWINEPISPAYNAHLPILYRAKDDESAVPVFSISARTDVEQIFQDSLKRPPTTKD